MKYRRTHIQNLKPGDTEERVKFAWRPVVVGEFKLWLERYRCLYAWIVTDHKVNIDNTEVKISTGEWVLLKAHPLKTKTD